MESIVTLHSGSPVVSSLVIAESIGRAHKVVIELVRKNLSDFEEFGTLPFETARSGGLPTTYALLSEPQATLLMTFLRNSPVVKAFKKRLVHAFYEILKNSCVMPDFSFVRRQRSRGLSHKNPPTSNSPMTIPTGFVA